MKVRALVLALLLAVCAPVWAARWLEVTTANSGSIIYVDVDSLRQNSNGDIDHWEKIVHKNQNNVPGETAMWGGQRVWYSLVLRGVDCGKGTISDANQVNLYGLQGQLLTSESRSYPSRKRPAPETVGEAIYNSVCLDWRLKNLKNSSETTPFLEQFRQQL